MTDRPTAASGPVWTKPGLLAGGALVLALLAAAVGIPRGGQEPSGVPAPSAIRVQPVGRADFTQSAPWLGKVESRGSVILVPTVAGRVLAVLAQDGARVKALQPLFALGGPRLEVQIASARAEESALGAELALARQIARRRAEAASLKVTDENVPAAAEVEVHRLEAAFREAQVRLASLKAVTTLRAPVAGVFTNRRVNPGQDVESGTPLADLVDPGRLRVVATVYVPSGVPLLGLRATVSMESRSDEASVVRVFPDQNPAGGTRVWVEGARLGGWLQPGAEVSGTVALAEHRQVLAVPRSAVVYDDRERPYVFVDRGGTYTRTPVALGSTSSDFVEVRKGLEAGDRVVVEGAYEVYYRDFGKTYQAED